MKPASVDLGGGVTIYIYIYIYTYTNGRNQDAPAPECRSSAYSSIFTKPP